MTIYGYDGSDFTHVMNFSGLSFVTHKGTEHAPEEIYYHRALASVMNFARQQNVTFLGVYVVPRTGVNVGQQAQTAIDFVRTEVPWLMDHPGFFWQVDLEHWEYDAVAFSTGEALGDELHARTGKPVSMYGSTGQYGSEIAQTKYSWWNANYNGSGASRPFPEMYLGDSAPGWVNVNGRTPDILQYCSDAIFADGRVGDANAFRGTEDDFRRRILGNSTPLPAPVPAPGGSMSSHPPLRVLDGVELDEVGRLTMEVYRRILTPEILAQLYVTSNVRRGDPGYHGAGFPGNGLDPDAGAIDIAAPMTDAGQALMRDVSEIMIRQAAFFLEYIHSTPYNSDQGYYVKNFQRVGETYYDAQTRTDHLNHMHNASTATKLRALLALLPEPQDPLPIPMPTPIPPLPVPDPIPEPTPIPQPVPTPVPTPDPTSGDSDAPGADPATPDEVAWWRLWTLVAEFFRRIFRK